MKKSLTVLAAALIAFASQAGAASWQADNADIDFLSIKVNQKKRSVTEESNFTASTARLEADGSFTLNVDLKSVKTSVDLRDERLRDWVFETGKFGTATITGKVDMATIDKLAVGQRLTLEQPLKLDLHGSKADIDATLSVYRRTADIIDVQTVNSGHPEHAGTGSGRRREQTDRCDGPADHCRPGAGELRRRIPPQALIRQHTDLGPVQSGI